MKRLSHSFRRVVAALCVALASVGAMAESSVLLAGTCGDAVSYALGRDGVLTITGTGPMRDYSSATQPWQPYRSYITKLVIDEGVTAVGAMAFYNCSSLISVSFPATLTTIGAYAFERGMGFGATITCHSTVPPTLLSTEINASVVGSLTLYVPEAALATYQATSPWQSFGTIRAFSSTEGLLAGTCGEGVSYRVDADGVLTITGEGAMDDFTEKTQPWKDYRTMISRVVVEEGVTGIGAYAFYGCNCLSITLGSSVAGLGDRAFYNCQKLCALTLRAASVPAVGSNIFQNVPMSNIALYVPASSVEAYRAAAWCSGFFRILAIENTDVISGLCGKPLAYELSDEGTLFIHGATSSYEYTRDTQPWAAYREQIKRIELSAHVYALGTCLFSGCTALTTIVCNATSVIGVGTGAFDDIPLASATLYVPASMVEAYQATAPWSDFGQIKAIGSEEPDEPDDPEEPEPYPEGVELTGKPIVGQWNILSINQRTYYDGVLQSERNYEMMPPYDRIDFTDNTITYMEYSDSRETWHEDGTGTYRIEDGKLVCDTGNGDFDRFIITAYDGEDEMEVFVVWTESEGSHRQRFLRIKLHRDDGKSGYLEPGSVELTGKSIVGQWDIVSGSTLVYHDDEFYEEYSETLTPPYDRIDFTDNTIMFMEYSDSRQTWHEDGIGTYRIEDNKLIYNKDGDFGRFAITAYDGEDVMEVLIAWTEDKGHYVQKEVDRATLHRHDGTTPLPDPREGQCGDAMTFSLVDGVLTIAGSGAMYDYTAETLPWRSFQNEVKTLVIAAGVTAVSADAFSGCTNVQTVVARAADPQGYRAAFAAETFEEAVLYVPQGTYWDYVYRGEWGYFVHIREYATDSDIDW